MDEISEGGTYYVGCAVWFIAQSPSMLLSMQNVFLGVRIIYHFFRDDESWITFETSTAIGTFAVGDNLDMIGDEGPLRLRVSEIQHQLSSSPLDPDKLLHEVRIFTRTSD